MVLSDQGLPNFIRFSLLFELQRLAGQNGKFPAYSSNFFVFLSGDVSKFLVLFSINKSYFEL